jgi:RNA polymerase sigma-70 factor (ECF subfamily)
MSSMPTTRASLLVRLRDPGDSDAWGQFVRIYGPVVYGFARKRGVQDADAADLMQEVLRSLMTSARRLEYDPKRGSFRNWLFTVTRNKLIDLREKQRRGQAVGGSSAQEMLDQQPSRDDESLWDEEFRRQVFSVAAEQVKVEFEPTTWSAFWSTAVEGVKPQEAAAALGISVGAVYVAKSRVQARLKERVAELNEIEPEN